MTIKTVATVKRQKRSKKRFFCFSCVAKNDCGLVKLEHLGKYSIFAVSLPSPLLAKNL